MIGSLKFKVINLEADPYNSYILHYTTLKIDQTVQIKLHCAKRFRGTLNLY